MKKKLFFITAFILFTNAVIVSAQSDSMWAVDFVKTKAGQQTDYLKFIEQNWARAREFMKQKGIVRSFRVLSVPADEKLDWDVLLITEYSDKSGYGNREAVFNEYKKLIENASDKSTDNKINVREISEIKFNRVFSQQISSDVGRAMINAQTLDAETAAARVPLETYLQGHVTGSPEIMKKAFITGAKIEGHNAQGKFISWTLNQYLKGMSGKPASGGEQYKRWIESLEVNGSAAVGKVIIDNPKVKVTDYMLLLKIGGEWKIVNKIFQAETKLGQK